MAQKCVHKGCGKTFTDPEDDCIYHPGPPIFHEGQKGWKCCKPRVLTFDEFLSIPPCTTGKHSTVEETPEPPKQSSTDVQLPPPPRPVVSNGLVGLGRQPQAVPTSVPEAPPPEPESDSDDPSISIKPDMTCRRRACGTTSTTKTASSREGEECVHHPGHPIFHEGSKGWTCCKRRVLEFDQFMQLEGCTKKSKHIFVGSGKKTEKVSGEKKLDNIRTDFYQTGNTVHASFYLKKISKAEASVKFSSPTTIDMDLPTSDSTRYTAIVPLFGSIDTDKSTFKILGTKLELNLVKADGLSWPVLRSDERRTGEIIQVGKAGVA